MDGLFHGKPYEQMDDLEGFSHYFWVDTQKDPYENQPVGGSSCSFQDDLPHTVASTFELIFRTSPRWDMEVSSLEGTVDGTLKSGKLTSW